MMALCPYPETCPPGAVALLDKVHTDEFPSQEEYDLYAWLCDNPNADVWAIEANQLTLQTNRATGAHKRYTHCNLQIVTPEEQQNNPEAYEVRRRQEIIAAIEPARIVIEPHGNRDELLYVVYDRAASPLVRGVAAALGAQHALLFGKNYLGYGRSNHLIIDVPMRMKHEYLPCMGELLGKLATGNWNPEPLPLHEYTFFRSVSVAEARAWGLPEEKDSFEPFSPADQQKLVAAGVPPHLVSVDWSYQKYGRRTGYVGELYLPVFSDDNLL